MSRRYGPPTTKNFGFGRSIYYASTNALRVHYADGHYETVDAHSERFSLFCDWLKSRHQVFDARQITQDIFHDYAAHLSRLVEANAIAVATATNRVSSVNVVMRIFRGDQRVHIDKIGKILGAHRNYVRVSAPQSMSVEKLNFAIDNLILAGFPRTAAIAKLARTTGMRLRECILADLPRLQREARMLGRINIQDGCKGGRSGAFAPRWIHATSEVLSALEIASKASPFGSRNLLAPTERYIDFLRGQVNPAREILRSYGIPGFHDLRASFACERYEQLVGIPAPIFRTSEMDAEPIEMDVVEARQIISRELGHERVGITNAYLGSEHK